MRHPPALMSARHHSGVYYLNGEPEGFPVTILRDEASRGSEASEPPIQHDNAGSAR